MELRGQGEEAVGRDVEPVDHVPVERKLESGRNGLGGLTVIRQKFVFGAADGLFDLDVIFVEGFIVGSSIKGFGVISVILFDGPLKDTVNFG